MQRYGTIRFTLIRQPRPGDRESRMYIAKDRSMQRPRREEGAHV